MGASWPDLLIIIGYLAAMMGVALWSSGKVRDLDDYALAGKSLSYPVMIGTIVGASIGAASTVGKAAKAYEAGAVFFFASAGYVAGLIMFGFFSRRLRSLGIWTIPDALKKRYGRGMDLVMGGAMLVAVIAIFGGQIIGMGVIFSSVGKSFGLTYTTSILIAGGVLIIYTAVGGLFAVAYTDMIQAAIMIVGIGVVLPFFVISSAAETGSVIQMMRPAPGAPLLGGMSPMYFASILIIDACFCLVDPGLWQRAGAARDERVIKNSMFTAAGVYVFWAGVCVVLGVLGSKLMPGLADKFGTTDAVIPALSVAYLPPVLVGLCLTGLMAVMMSTASVALLISGTTVANDLVKPLLPGLGDRGALIAARATVVLVGVMGVGFALVMKGIFDVLLLAFAVYVSGVFTPVMAALYWDKATRTGAVVSSIVATVVVVALYGLDLAVGFKPIEPILVSLFIGAVLMYVVSLATYDPATATPRLVPRKEG